MRWVLLGQEGWRADEYTCFGLFICTRHWGEARSQPAPRPARRPARLARVAWLVRPCGLPSPTARCSLKGRLRPRLPQRLHLFVLTGRGDDRRAWPSCPDLLVEEEAACARPLRPACRALMGIGGGLAVCACLRRACAFWLAIGSHTEPSALIRLSSLNTTARRRWRGRGGRRVRARRVACGA
jgi:hypothetical protein